MHVLRKDGDSIAALAMIVVDNPMLPGTGHRICNDCMKGCVFQKQEPVNIPQAETGVLTDVLGMRWGFEIYGLLTRWNPLNRNRPVARPYIGKNVLVVGLGPAGFTLSHHLLNAGFGVVGIDGLKVEPLPADLIGADAWPPRAVERWDELTTPLDERRLAGFGGVAEYGITVRWDKSFLGALHLNLARRAGFRVYGGVRFGGTVDADEAFAMGFDHVAIAAGAGKPTIIDVKNNLIRGVRKASDFLMALQLTGAAKRDSLASLQVRLPAIVIGGGLTGIDTTTEAAAYYPVQVSKFLERWETLAAEQGEDALFAGYDAEEAEIAREFLEHGRAVRAERARAAAAGEAPDFSKLVAAWGGVSLVYRKGMADSPAYRLNHEEIIEFFEEGVRFVEKLSPLACVPDERGALSGVEFETATGDKVTLPARTLFVAAGTSPNVTYERERPGSFAIDPRTKGFQAFTRASRRRRRAARSSRRRARRSASSPATSATGTPSRSTATTTRATRVRSCARWRRRRTARRTSRRCSRATSPGWIPTGRTARDAAWRAFTGKLDDEWRPTVAWVERLTPTIVEVVVRAPAAARHFEPGQFFRLQNFEALSRTANGSRLMMEGLALTGAWVDKAEGPAVADRARDGRQLAPVRGPARRASRSS